MIRRLLVATALIALAACNNTGKTGPAGPAGPEGPTGPQGPAGPGYDAPVSISGISPRELAVGLSTSVTISGYATKWTDQAVVNFGAGITVTGVKAASGTALLATITVAPDATPGPRDVTVREGTATITFKGFEVLPYASLTLEGVAKQGGLLRARVVVNDPMFLFPSEVIVSAGQGVSVVRVTKMLARTLEGIVGVDLDAAPGTRSVTVSTPTGSTLNFPDALNVTANTPADLPMLPATVTFSAPFESVVFNLGATASGTILEASSGSVLGMLAPDAGWTSSSPLGSSLLLQSEGGTLTLFDSAGDAGMSTIAGTMIPIVTDTEPNDTQMTSQAVMSLPVVLTGTLPYSGADDEDWYKVTVPASAAGRRVRVIATGPSYDFYVTLLQGGNTVGGRWNLYDYSGGTETRLGDPVAAGDLFIHLTPYDNGDYNLTLLFE